MRKNTQILRIIAFITAAFFTAEQLCLGMSPESLKILPQSEIRSNLEVTLPSELGTVKGVYFSERNTQFEPRSTIIHIQDAHANYEAQIQIKKILEYLQRTYGIRDYFLEGAAGKLEPKYLELFSDPKLNLKLADELAKQGEFTGAEMVLLENRKTRAQGIEEIPLYRQGYQALKKVFQKENESDTWLGKTGLEMDKAASQIFSPELREALQEWKHFEAGRREFLPYVQTLTKRAKKVLNLDLKDMDSQIEWPQLTRLLAVQEMEKKINPEQAEKEKVKLMTWLKRYQVTLSDQVPSAVSYLEKLDFKGGALHKAVSGQPLRQFLETFAKEANPKGFHFHDYPEFSRAAGIRILWEELNAEKMFEEIELLLTQILERLARSPEEKNLLALYRDKALLERLLHLELSRKEWERVSARRNELSPERMAVRLREFGHPEIASSSRQVGTHRNDVAKKIENPVIAKRPQADEAISFHQALRFYDIAIQREAAFEQKITSSMNKNKIQKAVVITGGFHTQGLEESWKKSETSFVTIVPRMNGENTLQKSLYRESMLQTKKTIFDLATQPSASILAPPKILQKMGFNPVRRWRNVFDHAAQIANVSRLRDLGAKLAGGSPQSLEIFSRIIKNRKPVSRLTHEPVFGELIRSEVRGSSFDPPAENYYLTHKGLFDEAPVFQDFETFRIWYQKNKSRLVSKEDEHEVLGASYTVLVLVHGGKIAAEKQQDFQRNSSAYEYGESSELIQRAPKFEDFETFRIWYQGNKLRLLSKKNKTEALGASYTVLVLVRAGKIADEKQQDFQRNAGAYEYAENSEAIRNAPKFEDFETFRIWYQGNKSRLISKENKAEVLGASYTVQVLVHAGKIATEKQQAFRFNAGAYEYAENSEAIRNAPKFEDFETFRIWYQGNKSR
ncbi:MAG: hypothetical protein EXS63_09770, partial [Candidatus Omnitrophica bacterium]|nr:hypothetical protein [Candidatus Omnitrophota bacterium]